MLGRTSDKVISLKHVYKHLKIWYNNNNEERGFLNKCSQTHYEQNTVYKN